MTLIEIVEGTFAAVGQQTTDTQLALIVSDLAGYPVADIETALARCRRELRGKMSLSDILDRLPHGHPGVEEAWTVISRAMDRSRVTLVEEHTIVWTDQMREAYGVAAGIANDSIAARMAFKEAYTKAVAEARANRIAPCWSVSGGTDPHQKETVLLEAIKSGKLKPEYASRLFPHIDVDAALLVAQIAPKLAGHV